MQTWKSLLAQDCFEEGIRRTVSYVRNENGRANAMIEPNFVSCSEANASITLEYEVKAWETNSNNVMHGGISATILDTTMGILANYLCIGGGRSFAPTVSMMINYLRPIPVGQIFVVEAKIASFGKNLITVTGEGRMKGAEDLSVTASATYISQTVGPRVGQVVCPVK